MLAAALTLSHAWHREKSCYHCYWSSMALKGTHRPSWALKGPHGHSKALTGTHRPTRALPGPQGLTHTHSGTRDAAAARQCLLGSTASARKPGLQQRSTLSEAHRYLRPRFQAQQLAAKPEAPLRLVSALGLSHLAD